MTAAAPAGAAQGRDPSRGRNAAIWLLLLAIPMFFAGLGAYDLDTKGEPREGLTAWETIHSHWLLPVLNGEQLPEKPLLFPWLVAVSMRFFGETSEWALRLPSALAGAGLVLVVWAIGRRVLSARGALLAASACAGTCLFVRLARQARVDMTLSFLVCGALLLFVVELDRDGRDPGSRASRPRIAAFWVLLALATLTKGPLGAILAGLVVGPYLLATRRLAFLKKLFPVWGVLLYLAIAGSWYAYGLVSYGHAFGYRSFLMENFMMFFGAEGGGGHRHGPFYFVPSYLLVGLPFSVLLPAAIVFAVRRGWGALPKEPLLLPLVWFASMFVFFSAASGKRPDYMLPLLPAASLLVAGAFDAFCTSADRLSRRLLVASAGILAALGVVGSGIAAFAAWAPAERLPAKLAEVVSREGARPFVDAAAAHPAALGVVLGAIAVASAAPLAGLLLARPAAGGLAASAGVAVVASVGASALMPVIAASWSQKPFARDIDRIAGKDAVIRNFDDFQAGVLFYLNRRAPHLEGGVGTRSWEHLDAFLSEPGVGWVLTDLDTWDKLPAPHRARFELALKFDDPHAEPTDVPVLLRRAPQ